MERTFKFNMGGMEQLRGMEQFLGIPSVMVGARMTTSKGTEKEVSVAAGSNTEVAELKQGAMPPVLSLPFRIVLLPGCNAPHRLMFCKYTSCENQFAPLSMQGKMPPVIGMWVAGVCVSHDKVARAAGPRGRCRRLYPAETFKGVWPSCDRLCKAMRFPEGFEKVQIRFFVEGKSLHFWPLLDGECESVWESIRIA